MFNYFLNPVFFLLNFQFKPPHYETPPGGQASGDVTVIMENGVYYTYCTGGGSGIPMTCSTGPFNGWNTFRWHLTSSGSTPAKEPMPVFSETSMKLKAERRPFFFSAPAVFNR